MSNTKQTRNPLTELSKSIGKILIEFYDTMKLLEKDEHRGGKQATIIVMTINDIEKTFENEAIPSCSTCVYSKGGKTSCFRHMDYAKPKIDYSKGVECDKNGFAHYLKY